MDLSSGRTKYKTFPYYKKRNYAPSTYLLQSRRELLSQLSEQHPLRDRTWPTGTLRPEKRLAISRPPFTDAEIRDINRRRNEVASDLDNASSQLQRSQLASMWNADYEEAEQQEEYDQAQSIMEERREYSTLPDEVSKIRDKVGEKRKRMVSTTSDVPSTLRILDDDDDMIVETGDLEEGEVVDDGIIQRIADLNRYLQGHNLALRRMIANGTSRSLPGALPSPPETDSPEQSEDDKGAVNHRVDATLNSTAEARQFDDTSGHAR